MEFFIKKNATLPLLKMQVVKDGRSDYNKMMDFIEESAIFFSMVNTETGIPKISTRPAGFVEKILIEPNASPEYYVYYQFTPRDTNTPGRYAGQFLFRNDQGTLILPIRDELFINVQESFIADDLPYDSCYVVDFPCCVSPGPFLVSPTPTPTPTNTPTPTPTPTQEPYPTPTLTPLPLELELITVITPGSVVINYNLIANQFVDQEVSMSFNHILETYTGSPISIFTGVTISINEMSGLTTVYLNENYDNLKREDSFGNIMVNPSNAQWIIYEEYPITPTPTPTPTNTPTLTPTNTPTPTPTTTPTPSNDLDSLIIPNNDLLGNDIPNGDLVGDNIPNNDLVGGFIPLNDLNDNQIPNDGLGSEIIPNNDFETVIIISTGGCYNLVTLPYFYPTEGNIIFPEFGGGGGQGLLNPNTFDVNGVDFNFIDNQGNDLYEYYSQLLSNSYLIYFTQNGNTAIYQGDQYSFSNEFGGLINGGIGGGTSQLVLVQPSPVDFIEGDLVCVTYEIIL